MMIKLLAIQKIHMRKLDCECNVRAEDTSISDNRKINLDIKKK